MIMLDTKTVIVNMLKEDKKTYLSIERLQKLLIYIYDELSKSNELNLYETHFDINFDAIERTVLYNNNIFRLDLCGEIIYLRETSNVGDLIREYSTDEKITKIIADFIKESVA